MASYVQHHRITDSQRDKRMQSLIALNHRAQGNYTVYRGGRPHKRQEKAQSAVMESLGIIGLVVMAIGIYWLAASF